MGLRIQTVLSRITLGIALFTVAPLAFALGLGEIKLNSNLNQPLNAEIQLVQTRELTAQEILVGLASREDFQRVGVDRPFFLTDLKFTVDMDAPGGPLVRVKSSKFVREPFLNFIVQVQWPSGKLLREYTVLLDLPVFADRPARAVTAPKAQVAAPPPAPRRATPAPVAQPRPVTRRQPAGTIDGGTYGPVRSSDTLWAIAARARPASDLSVQQTMLAIQRLNPDAFIRNNINLLKKGAVLRLPSESEIRNFDSRSAKQEVAQQNRTINQSVPTEQIDAARSTVDRGPAAEQVQGRLKLSSTTEGAGSKSGSGDVVDSDDSEALRTQLISTQEELAATERENSDLNERILSMDEQISTMEKLLEVASTDMRKLELALQNADAAATDDVLIDDSLLQDDVLDGDALTDDELLLDDPLSDGSIDELIDTDELAGDFDTEGAEMLVDDELLGDGDLLDDELVDDELVDADAAAEQAVADAPAVDPQPVPAPVVQQKTSLLDIIMDNILYIGGALILLIGGVVYFLMTRDNDYDDDFDFEDDESEDPIAGVADVEETQFVDQVIEPEPFGDDEISLDSLASELQAGSTSDSAIEQADQLIAQGDYDSALEMLSIADDTAEVELKRLEIFAKKDDLTAFDSQYVGFESKASGEQIESARDLRGLISTAVLGVAAASTFDTEAEPDITDLDTTLRFDAVTEDDIAAINNSSESTGLEETSLSLDSLDESLDLDLDEGLTVLDTGDLDIESTTESISEDLDFDALESDDTDITQLDLGSDLDLDDIDLETADLENPDLENPDLETPELDSSELDGIELDSAELDSAELDDIELDSSELDGIELDSAELDDAELSLDDTQLQLPEDGELTLSSDDSLSLDLDTEIRESSSIQEESDELDLSSLALPDTDDLGSDSLSAEGLELDLNDDLSDTDLSLDVSDGLSLDDLSIESDDISLDSEDLTIDAETEGLTADLEALGDDLSVDDLSVDDLSADDLAVEDLDVEGLDIENSDLEGLDVEGLDVEGIDVDGLDIEGLDLESLDVEDLDTEGSAQTSSAASLDELDSELGALDSELDELGELDNDLDELTSDFDGDLSALDDDIDAALSVDPAPAVQPEALTAASMPEAANNDADTADVQLPDFDADSDDDSEPGFLGGGDEVATKLDLLRVFVEMGDTESALDTLEEIRTDGNDAQKQEAEGLFSALG